MVSRARVRAFLRARLTAVGAAALASALIAACKPDPEIAERTLFVYSPRSCPVSQTEAYSVVYGNGDFRDAQNAVSSLFLRDVGTTLSELPMTTRSLIVDVSHPAKSVDWRGVSEVPPQGPINVLVWPGGETCRLSTPVQPRTDVAFGVFGRHLMVAGGKLTGQVPLTFVGDLSTGIVDKLPVGVGRGRSRATITEFRESPDQDPAPALVAGGEDPTMGAALGTAELYLPKPGAAGDIGEFVGEPILLSEQRTKHGAVVLATGETLLVGGTGQFGSPLATMEIIDPKTKRFRTGGVALLAVPRSNPTVLRLASGEILVAGGFSRTNQPVPTLEWFSADASHPTKRPVDLVTGRERAFVPLEAGGALAVIAPSSSGTADFPTVWVISANGTLEAGLPVDPTQLEKVRLFPGADGAPVLWTGLRWLRWSPWFSAFQPVPDAPTNGPSTTAIANGDSGLALWLDDRIENQLFVTGWRFATKSRFGAVRNPLIVDGVGTLGLAPDRATGTASRSIRYVQGRGLELGPGASAFVTDATFADVDVDLDLESAPSIVLRQTDGKEIQIGGAGCGFFEPAARTVHVERIGRTVSVRFDQQPVRICPSDLDEGARVSIGVRGVETNGTSVARNLRISRR